MLGPVNEEVLKVALAKRGEILRKLAVLSERSLAEAVREWWVEYEPRPRTPPSVSGVDGGQAIQEFQGFTIYAVSAASITYESSGRSWLPKTLLLADVDVLTPPSVSARVSLYREALEAKAGALAAHSKVKLLLMDGSLRSVIIEPRPRGEGGGVTFDKALQLMRRYYGGGVAERLVEAVEGGLEDPASLRESPLVSGRLLRLEEVPPKHRLDVITAAEYVEKLASYRALLRLAVGGVTLAYVSKRSRTSNYFTGLRKGRLLPTDIMIFQYLTSGPGFSKPILPEERRVLKHVPDICGFKEFFSRLRVWVTYVRLEEGGPVLRVEIPALGEAPLGYGEVKSLVDSLAGVSANGYPYPLHEADKVVRVPKATLSVIVNSLGLQPYLTGREVLEEWMT